MNGDDPKAEIKPQPTPPPATPNQSPTEAAAPAAPNGGFFHAEDPSASAANAADSADRPVRITVPDNPPLEWVAADVGANSHSPARYIGRVVVVVLAAAVIFFLTKSPFSAGAIAVIGLLFGIVSAKKPHPVHYVLDRSGIIIGPKKLGFGQFRSFVLVDEGGYTSIELMPLKRFLPALSVFYSPEIQDDIINALSAHLPMEEHKRDLIDQLTSLVKF